MELNNLNALSEQLLLEVKLKKDTSSLEDMLQAIDTLNLSEKLNTDNKKKAFWINIYNAYYQILRKKNFVKPDIYKKKLFTVAKQKFSLDDVEHGILRKYKYKYSLGFFANIFARKAIKRIAVDNLDYRIHFALNCGAKSCPPIAFYKESTINAQLDLATLSFLEGETEFDEVNKKIHTTALFKWFYADFGGTEGIKRIFKEKLGKDVSDYKINYKEYSWEDDLDNFAANEELM